MYKYVIAKSPNGYDIYVDLITSSAGHCLSRQPYLINLIKEVLMPMHLKGPNVSIEYDMGRVIGNTEIVTTSDKDAIFYAKSKNQNSFSRFVKNRSMSPTSQLTIILERDGDNNYELSDTWIGQNSPPFPGDGKETKLSKSYWESHALVMDQQVIQSKTITKVCPY